MAGTTQIVRLAKIVGYVVGALAAFGCQSSTSSGHSSLWIDSGRIARTIHSGTTSDVEEGTVIGRKGQVLEVMYDVAARQGTVRISVWRAFTRLDGVTIEGTRQGVFKIPIEQPWRYDVRVQPVWFGGTYDVSWRTR